MANSNKLNAVQVRVLDWIRDGCPDGVYTEGYSHRLTARALASRGLVTITGHGDSWKAVATPAGEAWTPGAAPASAKAQRRVTTFGARNRPAGPRVEPSVPPIEPPVQIGAADLYRDVVAAGGKLALGDDPDLDAYNSAIKASVAWDGRPRGVRLALVDVGSWQRHEHQVWLTDYFEEAVDVREVSVPESVGRYHPLVQVYRKARDWQYVTPDHVPRAARVLQAIVVEAERRGWRVELGAALRAGEKRREHGQWPSHLVITLLQGEALELAVHEMPGKGAHRREYRFGRGPRVPAWMTWRQYEFVSTGDLYLEFDGIRHSSAGRLFKDGKRSKLEAQVSQAFYSIEVESLYQARRAVLVERERAERKRAWEGAMEVARARFYDESVWKQALALADVRDDVRRVREFVGATRGNLDGADAGARGPVLARLDEIDVIADSRDPVARPELVAKAVPRPGPEDLKPFLGGLSPFAPATEHIYLPVLWADVESAAGS